MRRFGHGVAALAVVGSLAVAGSRGGGLGGPGAVAEGAAPRSRAGEEAWRAAEPLSAQAAASRELARLFEEDWEFHLREDPLFATETGDGRYNDRLPSVRPADFERRLGQERAFLERWRRIDRSALGPEDRVHYDVFGRWKRDEIAELEFGAYLIPITNRSGFHISFAQLAERVPLRTVRDYENYVARLRGFRTYAEEHVELMREGIRRGWVLPRVVLEGVEAPIEAQIVDDPTRHRLYAPFREFPSSVPEPERARLAEAGRRAIAESVVPGYRAFLRFMTEEYLPAARASIGASDLPNGRGFYEHRVRQFTTLDVTPEAVHELGMREVRRIRAEMDALVERVGFAGGREAYVAFLRSDDRFYAESPEALLKEVAYTLKRMDGELPRLFGRLPRMPYGIRPVPEYIAPRTTTAYYEPPAGDGSRAGFYYVNTYDLRQRPLYEVEALSFHEAVPGHHLQIALQQELDLPPFRRFLGFTAFVEGWALYAERLGLEVGFYRDPASDFGRLSYEMWRACRLVVDTGIHALGWSRTQAIDFMRENTALSRHNIEAEVDRYIAWPGQALAYKMGERKIRELRDRAERELGPRFDVRAFHDLVLGHGALPLDVLETLVLDSVARIRGSS
jgi:uncharacterized protein (DUF885 family)